jgi:hypothetical protein
VERTCNKFGKGKGKGTDRSLGKMVLKGFILRGERGVYIEGLGGGEADKSGDRADNSGGS